MTGWLDTMIVESKHATKFPVRTPLKMSQKVLTLTPARKGDLGFDSASSSLDGERRASLVLPIVLASDFLRDLMRLESRELTFAKL